MKIAIQAMVVLLAISAGLATAWILKKPPREEPGRAQPSATATDQERRPSSTPMTREANRTERLLIRMADAGSEDFLVLLDSALERSDRKEILMLMTRWGERDLEGLLDFALERGGTRFEGKVPEHAINFFYELVRPLFDRDPQFAMDSAARFTDVSLANSMQWYFITELAKTAPDQAFQLMLEHSDTMAISVQPQSNEVAMMLAEKLSSRSHLTPSQEIVMRNLVKRASRIDRERGFDLWKRLPESSRVQLLSTIMPRKPPALKDEIGREIYREARRAIEESPDNPGIGIGQFLRVFANHLAEDGLVESVEWVESRSHGAIRLSALRAVYSAGIDRDPIGSREAFDALPPGPLRTQLSSRMAVALFKDDPSAAFEFAAGLPGNQTGRFAWQSIARNLAKQSPTDAIEMVDDLPDHPGAVKFVETASVYYSREAPVEAIEWASGLGGDRGEIAIGAVIEDWMRIDTEAAMAHVESMPGGEARDTAFRSVVTKWIHMSGLDSTDWLSQTKGADRDLARQAIDQLAESNPGNNTLLSKIRTALD